MARKSFLLAAILTLASLSFAQTAPATPAPGSHDQMDMAHHDKMADMRKQHMEGMKADLDKMKASLEQMKANVAKIRNADEKERWQANVDLWSGMVAHMEQMMKHMDGMGPEKCPMCSGMMHHDGTGGAASDHQHDDKKPE